MNEFFQRIVNFLFRRKASNKYEAGKLYNPNRSYLDGDVVDVRYDLNESSREEILRKAIYWEQNNAIVNRLADVFEQYVVGTGLVLTPSSSNEDWNQRAKAFWDEWCRFPDLCSRQHFNTIQGLIARLWFIHGEVFILKTQGDSGRFRIQLIESHRVSTPPNQRELEGESIIDGVQVDKNGRPIAYWVQVGNNEEFRPYKAESVIHVFEPSRVGQYRGVSFLHAVLGDIHDLDDLQILEQQVAKKLSTMAAIVYNESGEASDADRMRVSRHRDTTQNLAGLDIDRERSQYYKSELGAKTVYAKRGDKIEIPTSDRPGVAQREHWDYLTSKICAGVGITKQLVFPWSVQGTIARADLDNAAAFFRSRSSLMAWVVNEVFIAHCQRESRLQDRPIDWTSTTTRSPRAVNVDVGRNSSAMLAELKAGATTFEQIYAPLGLDWRQQLRQRAKEQKFIQSVAEQEGIDPSTVSEFAVSESMLKRDQEYEGDPETEEDEEEIKK